MNFSGPGLYTRLCINGHIKERALEEGVLNVTHAPATSDGRFATKLRFQGMLAILAACLLTVPLGGPAHAETYNFIKLADSAEDGFDPFSFGCASINGPGDVAFRAGRPAADGFNTVAGIYRVNRADGSLTTIAEDERRFDFIGNNPSMNDLGQVSFAANLDRGYEAILRGSGEELTVIASTRKEFGFFGFDTSVNNRGVVAFKAELDEEFGFDEGLFSGRGGPITTHYLTSTSRFDGNDSRPSINDARHIAFEESIDFEDGIFVTDDGGFIVVAKPDPDRSVGKPVLNEDGTVAFEASFVDQETSEFVSVIMKVDRGSRTPVAGTRGPFAFFGFRPPSLNNLGQAAFHATLDDFSTSGIFVGRDAVDDRVIATGDTLDGSKVQNVTFCEEGLNDSGQLAFIAALEEPDSPEGFRTAVFLASPSA